MKLVAVVLVVELSPKSQNRLVMVPLELSLKLTVSGLRPLVGLPLKLAAGATAPVPASELVLLPALLLLITTTLLKVAALVGAKRTTTLVEPKPARLKGVPETMVKGPPLIVATPLLSDAPPWLVIAKLAWALEPTATVPKLRLPGETPSWAGVRPLPVAVVLVVELSPKSQNRLVMVPLELSLKLTVSGLRPLVGLPLKLAAGATAPVPASALVLLPALLLLITTTLLKVSALVGAKRTTTLVEPKPARLKGVPETMVKGPPLIVARPLLSAAPPWLVIAKLAWALEPTATVPKLRLPGETPSWAGVRPLPVTVLAVLPPLLVKTTTSLKLPALAGLKPTCTCPD